MDEAQRSALAVADRIRGSQIHAMETNVPQSLIGYLVAALLASVVAWADWAPLIVAWAPFAIAICLIRIAIARRTARHPVRPLGLGAERFLMAATATVSVVIAIGPAWIALHSDGLVSAMMIMLIVGTMWGGALVQAPLFSSAVAFTTANIPVWLAYLMVGTPSFELLCLAALFFVLIVVALDNVRRYARSFEAGLRQRIALEQQSDRMRQQAEVIGLLLKDHEDQSSDWLWQTDDSGRIVAPSARFAEALGARGRALEGMMLADLFIEPRIGGNAEAVVGLTEQLAERRSFRDLVIPGQIAGEPRWWSLSGRPVADASGAPAGFRGVMGDVTVAKAAQAHVHHLAHHDGLTGLANRTRFCDQIQRDLDLGPERPVAIISIDLDGFKPVNDRFGHPVGDALLIAIARLLRTIVGTDGLVARLGGDEFAIALPDRSREAIEPLCRQILTALVAAHRIGPDDILVGASIGIAIGPADGSDVETLLKNADAALYRAKREGRGQSRFFEAGMDRQTRLRLALLQDLRDALHSNQLSLHYQPFVDSTSGVVTGCEALLRWQHPTRGQVSPADFIPLAEDSGLITEIGRWVLARACEAAARWPDGIRVSVNVSPRQFKDRTLPGHIAAVLRDSGLAPDRLEIEVTEAVLIDDAAAAVEILRRIRAIGVKLSLDDFGTGYSSLSYLRDFPFDKVKIDRSFVRDIEERHDSQVIVQGIRSIALGLGMTITAEGVETPGQAQRLRSSGCHELQGFLFSRAQPESRVPALLRERHQVGVRPALVRAGASQDERPGNGGDEQGNGGERQGNGGERRLDDAARQVDNTEREHIDAEREHIDAERQAGEAGRSRHMAALRPD